MADQIQLQIILSAQVDRVLAGLSSVEKGLAQMQASQDKAAAASAQHQSRFEAFTNSVERAAKVFAGIWVLWQAAKDAFAGFEGLETFNLNLQTMTSLLQGNATAASTWMQIASLMNLDVSQLERSFVSLSRQMNSASSPALKQMGISAVDTRGQLKSINEVILESADYFHRHEGASNNAALAQQLFGRSGAELLPILEQGRAGIDTITASARKFGLVLTADAIQKNAELTEQLKVSEMAARGLGVSLGNAALPAVAALASGFNNLVSQNLPAFEAGIARAVGYILGFAQAVTGMSFTMDDSAKVLGALSASTSNLGTQQESASAAADALARAEDNVRSHAKAATDAIDKQIASLRGMQDAQKFVDDQARLQQELADKGRDIQKLQHDQYTQFWLGNFATAADVGDQITKDQEDQANIQQDLSRGVTDEQTRLKIAGLDLQKKAIQDAADAEIKQMERASKGGAAAFAAAGGAIVSSAKKTAKDSGDAFHDIMSSAAAQTGADMGKKLMDALFGAEVWVDSDRKIQGHFERAGGGDWGKIGNAIGASIGTGVATAIGPALMGGIKGSVHSIGTKIGAVADQIGAIPGLNNVAPGLVGMMKVEANILKSFHTGGEVPGGPNQEVPSVLLGQEWVLTRDQKTRLQTQLRDASLILGGSAAPAASVPPAASAASVALAASSSSTATSRAAEALEALPAFRGSASVGPGLGSRLQDPSRLLGTVPSPAAIQSSPRFAPDSGQSQQRFLMDPAVAELLKVLVKTSDPSRTNQLLQDVVKAIIASREKAGGGPGAQADLFNAMDESKRWRALGVVGY